MSEAMYKTQFLLKTIYDISRQKCEIRKVFVVRAVIAGK
jgi:hypothetical protein